MNKKMKNAFVFVISAVFMIFAGGMVAAQNSAAVANRNTALRCLKLAENCLMGSDWSNAVKQADLGLTYDDSISDLIYVKAAAEINLDKSKAEVIELVKEAFAKNNWVGYNKNGARILYADLLSDTGSYSESMSLLDSNPLIYSADAEFIRIKNFYRMGSEETVNNARLKLNTARRVYPTDIRFPNIFFMFEYLFKNNIELNGQNYVMPEIVKNISSYYISKLPDYKNADTQLELLAAFFANGDEKIRLANAIEAKNKNENPLLSILCLSTGIYSDAKAYDSFIASTGDNFNLRNLETLTAMLSDGDVKNQLMEKLLNYSGSIFIDEDNDLLDEIEVEYATGRPQYIRYDANNDGVIDINTSCDFGAPLLVYFQKNNSEVFYESYPGVLKVSFLNDKFDFNFLHGEYNFKPFDLAADGIIASLGIDFYIPSFAEIQLPDASVLITKTSSVDLPVTERDGAVVKYNTLDGKLVYANFYEKDLRYAYCDFNDTLPIIRYVDYDNDGYFETTETYDVTEDDSLYDKEAVTRVFSSVIGETKLYLKKVSIDRNGNTFPEFSESYLENNGKVTFWDNDDNGIWDCEYIRYPKKEGEALKEESIFFDTNGLPLISVNQLDGLPVKMIYREAEVMIYAGQNNHFYWIEEEGTADMEKTVLAKYENKIAQGVIEIVDFEDSRFSVIKVGEDYFCKILPPSEVEIELPKADEAVQ